MIVSTSVAAGLPLVGIKINGKGLKYRGRKNQGRRLVYPSDDWLAVFGERDGLREAGNSGTPPNSQRLGSEPIFFLGAITLVRLLFAFFIFGVDKARLDRFLDGGDSPFPVHFVSQKALSG